MTPIQLKKGAMEMEFYLFAELIYMFIRQMYNNTFFNESAF